MNTTIEGSHRWYARLSLDGDKEVRVEIWRWLRRADAPVGKLISVWSLPCRWHVALDEVHTILWKLEEDDEAAFPRFGRYVKDPAMPGRVIDKLK